MDTDSLENHIESLSREVHNAWWEEKKMQGFHPPLLCKKYKIGGKFTKHCPECHTDMYLYGELPENVKEYDRVTVLAVLKAIRRLENKPQPTTNKSLNWIKRVKHFFTR